MKQKSMKDKMDNVDKTCNRKKECGMLTLDKFEEASEKVKEVTLETKLV